MPQVANTKKQAIKHKHHRVGNSALTPLGSCFSVHHRGILGLTGTAQVPFRTWIMGSLRPSLDVKAVDLQVLDRMILQLI